MADFNKNIDSLLNGIDERAEFPDIKPDWNAFVQKRRKKAILFWTNRSLIALAITTAAYLVFFLNQSPIDLAGRYHDKGILHLEKALLPDNSTLLESSPNPENERTEEGEFVNSAPVGQVTKPNHGSSNLGHVNQTSANTNTNSNPNLGYEGIPNLTIRSAPGFTNNWPVYQVSPVVLLIASHPALEIERDTVRAGKFHLDFCAGVDVINPHLIVTELGAARIHKQYQSIRNDAEVSGISMSLRASVIRRFGRFEPGLGLGLSRLTIPGNYNFVVNEAPVIDLDGKILGYRSQQPVAIKFSSNHNFTFVNIPVGLGISVLKRAKGELILQQRLANSFIVTTAGESPHPVDLSSREPLQISNLKLSSAVYSGGLQWRYHQPTYNIYLESAFSRNLGIKQSTGLTSQRFNALSIRFGLIKNIL